MCARARVCRSVHAPACSLSLSLSLFLSPCVCLCVCVCRAGLGAHLVGALPRIRRVCHLLRGRNGAGLHIRRLRTHRVGCGGGRARVQRVQEGARGWARTWSAHCRAFAAFARASKRTRVPGVSSFMTQPRTSSHRIFAGAAPRGRFRRPLSARDCFCFARRAAQYPASLTPGISAAAFNAGLQNMRGGSSERKNAAKGRFTFCILIDHRGPPGAILRNSARGPYKIDVI